MSGPGGDARPTSQGLAGLLRALREATRPRISQTAAAKAIGASQNKISRAESGQWVLTAEEVRHLARLYGATAEERRRLVAWAEALAPGEVPARQILRRGGGTAAFQARIRQLEEGAHLVRAYQPAMVFGQLQTRAYATVVFGGDSQAVEERLHRNRLLLDDDTRRWELVQPIGALLWNLGSHEIMAEQMDALIDASARPHVDLRIVTSAEPCQFFAIDKFHIYDGKAVLTGILTATTLVTDPRDVAAYETQHSRLMSAGVAGDEARGVIAEIAEMYRRGPG